MSRFRILSPWLALLLGAALAGCSSHPNATELGTIKVRLTDAPGDFQAVNIVVRQVSIHRAGDEDSDSNSDSGWEVLSDTTHTYDLLVLRNGVFATLAVGEIPAGHYTQMRLKLGDGSNVVVDGVVHPLVVPSGLQSGLKLIGGFDVPAGGTLELTLDFDANRSVVLTGSNTYKLKPTIRVVETTVSGAITGHLLPEGVDATVFAIAGSDTVQTTSAMATGHFTLNALLAGTYSVAVHPAADFRDTTLTGIQVSTGATTDVGDIQLTAP